MPEYELSDITAKYISDASLDGSNRRVSDGKMYVSPAKAFILTFLAIAIAVGVGIIVHFAGTNGDNECFCTFPDDGTGNPDGTSSALEQCEEWAQSGNTNICSKCPNQSDGSTCPPVTQASTTQAPPSSTAPTTHALATTTSSSGQLTTPSIPVLNVRLPTSLEPLLYELELQPNMYAPLLPDMFTFNGSVKILLRCRNETNNITLHINKLNVTGSITVLEENGLENLYHSHTFDTARQFIIIQTNRQLMANKNYTVNFEQFVGPLISDLAGLYLSSYTRNNETIYITTSQMQATDARKTFPCMDEPAIKAQFKVTLYRKNHMVSLSNMPVIDNQTLADNWVADYYQTTPAMPTYLLAFIVCDFRYKENVTTNNIRYRAWSRPEAINQTDYSLKVGVDILTYFEEFFNISYPLPKQDMIAIPDFSAGAMENWGLITYRETAMLYEPGVSSAGNKQRVAVVVSHELAHQWFGNLVTPSWWDDLWLNEGFASYVEYMGVDEVEPDWRMFEQFVVEDLQDVFSIDGLVSSHPVYVPVNHPDEINEIFDRISYAKGASIIRMMRFFLGDSIFKNGLTRYLKSRAYGAAFHDDLWNALGEQAAAENSPRTNVKEIMDTWTLQMNYPVVMVTYEEAGRISLTQSRYLVDPTATDPGKYEAEYKWEIPFAFTTSSDREFNVTHEDVIMMGSNDGQLTIEKSVIPVPEGTAWVLGNPMQYGYYRVNYDERNWGALIEQLKTDHLVIHPINRAQIINDAWNLAKSGELPMRTALGTTEYLNQERDYIPWVAASTELKFVANMLERHQLYGPFMKFMRNKTEDTFSVVTMNNTGATHIESFLRSEIASLACMFGIDECVNEAVKLFSQWMNNPSVNPIDPGLKSNVYCKGVEEGGSEEWEFIYNQYQTANLAAEKSRLMYAMSCSKHVWILSRYLNMALDETAIRRQDTVSVIVYVSRNTVGRSLVWDYVRQHWSTFAENFGAGSFSFSSLISGITSSFNTEFDLQQLQEFMDAQDNLGSGARAFEQALENTRSNIGWMEKNVPIIQSWLTEQGF